jgi:hypothetical protein
MEPVQLNCMTQLYRSINVFWFLQNHLAILVSQMLMQINSECGQYINPYLANVENMVST